MAFFRGKNGLTFLSVVIIGIFLFCITIDCPAVESTDDLRLNGYLEQICNDVRTSSDEKRTIKFVYDKLISNGWREDAANAVIETNLEYFAGLYWLTEAELQNELIKYIRLGNKDEIQQTLVEQPELATLFGSTMPFDKDAPKLIINTIPNDEEGRTAIINLYVLYAGKDAIEIAKLLQNVDVRDRIVSLLNKSPTFIKYIDHFVFADKLLKKDKTVGEAYQKWLFARIDEIIRLPAPEDYVDKSNDDVSSPDSELNEFTRLDLTFEINSKPIREYLCDPEFRKNVDVYWTWYKELLDRLDKKDSLYKLKWLQCVHDSRIWKMFQSYGKEPTLDLYQRYGEHAADILLLPEILDRGRERRRDALLSYMRTENGKEKIALVTANLPENKGYFDLLDRSNKTLFVYNSLLQLALAEQGEGKKTPEELIEYWKSIGSNEALEKELSVEVQGFSWVEFLPGYDVWHIFRKMEDGRDVTAGDYIFAIVDAAFTTVDIITLGSSKGATSGAKTGIKGITTIGRSLLKDEGMQTIKLTSKNASHKVLETIGKTTGETGAREGAELLTRTSLEASGKRTTLSIIYEQSRYFTQLCSNVKSSSGVDITDLTRYVYSKSKFCKNNLGAETFKKTTELDARFFMTSKGRIVTIVQNLPNTRVGKSLGVVAKNTTSEIATSYGLYAVCSTEIGQEAIRSVGENLTKWRTNLSTWWLINSERVLDNERVVKNGE